MEAVQTTETAVSEAVEERSVEQQMEDMRKISEMRFKALSQLVEIHFQEISKIMLASNGVTELQKRQANTALLEALKFTLDMGLNVTGATIRQGGVLAKQVNTLAGVLAQAMDTRMLLLADNFRKEEETKNTTATTEVVEETKGEENV